MQRRQKFEIKGVMIQYNTRVETQSPNDYKRSFRLDGNYVLKDDRAQKCWVLRILQKRKSSLFTCQCTSMKSIRVLLSGRALHYLELLIINNLNITSWEETAIALRTQPLPPSRVNLINVQYDLAGIEGNLSRVRSLVVIKSYSTCAVKLSGLLDSPSPVTTVGWCTPPFPQYWGGNKASLPPLSSDECDYQMQEEGEQYHWAPLPYHPQCSPCFPQ